MAGASPQKENDRPTKPGLAYVHTSADRERRLRELFHGQYIIHSINGAEPGNVRAAATSPANPETLEIAVVIIDTDDPGVHTRVRELFPGRPVIEFRDPTDSSATAAARTETETETEAPESHEALISLRPIKEGDLPEPGLLRGAIETSLDYYQQVARKQDLTARLAHMNNRLETLLEGRARRVSQVEDQARAERRSAIIEQELDKARKIQSAVLPRSIPEPAHLSISTLYLPLDKIGGDFYGFVDFRNGDLGIYIADVSGHGIPAAFIAAMVKLQFDQTAPFISSPAETLAHLNESLQDRTGGHFLTIFYAIIRKNEHRVTYARAGHCSPYLHRKTTDEIVELNSRGRMLGVFPELRSADTEIGFGPQDRLVLYTDGILESRDMRNPERGGSEIFGEERLRNTILNGGHETGYDFIDLIMADVEKFSGIPYFEDDVTLMVVDRSR